MKARSGNRQPTDKSLRRVYLVIGLVLVVVIVVGVLLFPRHDPPQPDEPKRIKPTKAVAVKRPSQPVNPAAMPAPEPVVMKRDRNGNMRPFKRPETYRDEQGTLRYKAGGARAPEPDEFKNAIKIDTPNNGLPRFKHNVENEIATLLTLEPGGALFGDPHFDERFEQDFVNSLLDPIQIDENDSEADKQIKLDVEATKKDLAARVRDGEKLADIFTGTRDEIRRLAAVKQNLLDIAREQTANADMSDAEVATYYEAVNKMLEAKGIAPVRAGAIMKRRAIRQARMKNKSPQPTTSISHE